MKKQPKQQNGLITQAEYARKRGVSKQYLNRLVQLGAVPLRKGRIDPAAADKAIEANTTGPSEDGSTFASWRREKEKWAASLKRLEYQARAGELISREEVRAEWLQTAALLRTKLLNLPKRLAPVLVGTRTPADAENILTQEIHGALAELAGLNNKHGKEMTP